MRFDYENPNQTAQAKVEILRSVVHHSRGVEDLPWKYRPENPDHIDRAEVETLAAIVGLFQGDGLPEYLDPKPPEPVEEVDGSEFAGEPDANPPEEVKELAGKALAGIVEAGAEAIDKLRDDLGDDAEVKATEDPGVAEIVPNEGVEAVVDESGDVTLQPEEEKTDEPG
jgi:hypothetical protein